MGEWAWGMRTRNQTPGSKEHGRAHVWVHPRPEATMKARIKAAAQPLQKRWERAQNKVKDSLGGLEGWLPDWLFCLLAIQLAQPPCLVCLCTWFPRSIKAVKSTKGSRICLPELIVALEAKPALYILYKLAIQLAWVGRIRRGENTPSAINRQMGMEPSETLEGLGDGSCEHAVLGGQPPLCVGISSEMAWGGWIPGAVRKDSAHSRHWIWNLLRCRGWGTRSLTVLQMESRTSLETLQEHRRWTRSGSWWLRLCTEEEPTTPAQWTFQGREHIPHSELTSDNDKTGT